MALLARIVSQAISTATGVLVRDAIRDWLSGRKIEPDGFPPSPPRELVEQITSLGPNVVPVWIYKDYGIVYGRAAKLIARELGIPLHLGSSGKAYVLFSQATCQPNQLRDLGKFMGLRGIKANYVSVELSDEDCEE